MWEGAASLMPSTSISSEPSLVWYLIWSSASSEVVSGQRGLRAPGARM